MVLQYSILPLADIIFKQMKILFHIKYCLEKQDIGPDVSCKP